MGSMELNSRGYVLINRSLGVEVGAKNAEMRVPVASLAKIMTVLVVIEKRSLDEIVVVTEEMLRGLEGFAKIGLRVGQKVSVEDLLFATMLPSAGDAAQALAISTSGSIAEFAEAMNDRAGEMGLKDTCFNNPVGMDDNYSTPRDIAMILGEALKNEKFVEIFEAFEKDLSTIGVEVKKTFAKTWYIKGGKTGFTNDAGRCLASTAEVEGTEYMLVTVGAEFGQNLIDAEKVYAGIEADYEPMEIVRKGEWIVKVPIRGSKTEGLEFLADENIVVALENEIAQEELVYEYEGEEEITRQTGVGESLGRFRIKLGEQELYEKEIYYDGGVEFYDYDLVKMGVGVSLVMLVIGVVGVVGMRKKVKGDSKKNKLLTILGLGGFLASLILNLICFSGWFEERGVFEINKPEIRVVEELKSEKNEDEESKVVEEDLSENSGDSGNCTLGYGNLMLINLNFKVEQDFIAVRRQELISVSQNYGIPEYNSNNGDNLLMPEAAKHLFEMVKAYEEAYPGHTMGTRSCFRAKGTSCGRLCAATGTSDHHTGLTCDLIDNQYGTSLDTKDYDQHLEWQWLRGNSYKYGFIDRFPEEWAGGKMSEPLNVDGNGTTGLYETWHYRYVGVKTATEIAEGKYNGGRYDSLEHYLKVTGRVVDLRSGVCAGE